MKILRIIPVEALEKLIQLLGQCAMRQCARIHRSIILPVNRVLRLLIRFETQAAQHSVLFQLIQRVGVIAFKKLFFFPLKPGRRRNFHKIWAVPFVERKNDPGPDAVFFFRRAGHNTGEAQLLRCLRRHLKHFRIPPCVCKGGKIRDQGILTVSHL